MDEIASIAKRTERRKPSERCFASTQLAPDEQRHPRVQQSSCFVEGHRGHGIDTKLFFDEPKPAEVCLSHRNCWTSSRCARQAFWKGDDALNWSALKDQTNWLLRTDIAKWHIQVESFVDRTDKSSIGKPVSVATWGLTAMICPAGSTARPPSSARSPLVAACEDQSICCDDAGG